MSASNPGDRAGWFWICIEDLEGGVISGTLQSQYCQEPRAFRSLDHLLQLAEEAMDEVAFPQSDVRKRSFTDPQKGWQGHTGDAEGADCSERRRMAELVCPKFEAQYGKYGVFDMRVFYRRSASWQGEIFYLNRVNRVKLMFRSALELVCAMRYLLLDTEKSENADGEAWDVEAELCAAK